MPPAADKHSLYPSHEWVCGWAERPEAFPRASDMSDTLADASLATRDKIQSENNLCFIHSMSAF